MTPQKKQAFYWLLERPESSHTRLVILPHFLNVRLLLGRIHFGLGLCFLFLNDLYIRFPTSYEGFKIIPQHIWSAVFLLLGYALLYSKSSGVFLLSVQLASAFVMTLMALTLSYNGFNTGSITYSVLALASFETYYWTMSAWRRERQNG